MTNVGRVIVLAQLAIDRELDLQLVGIANLIGRDDIKVRSGLEAVEGLAEVAPEGRGRMISTTAV